MSLPLPMRSYGYGMVAVLLLGSSGCSSLPRSGAALDFRGQSLSAAKCSERGLPEGTTGVLVEAVPPDSALDRAGIRKGDVIVDMGSEPARSYRELARRVYLSGPTAKVRLRVWSKGDWKEVDVAAVPAERRWHLGVGTPWHTEVNDQRASLLPLSVVDVGTGPDRHGFFLLRLLGYERGPTDWQARLVLFQVGESIRIVREEQERESFFGGRPTVSMSVP